MRSNGPQKQVLHKAAKLAMSKYFISVSIEVNKN